MPVKHSAIYLDNLEVTLWNQLGKVVLKDRQENEEVLGNVRRSSLWMVEVACLLDVSLSPKTKTRCRHLNQGCACNLPCCRHGQLLRGHRVR